MGKQQKLSNLTPEQYLIFEAAEKQRHEYVDGQVFAMAGGSAAHNVVALNIAMSLRAKLQGKGCTVYISDMKVRIDDLNCFYYPDLMIDCGAFDKESVYTKTPSIIFEVLSRFTASTDRREKLVAYRHVVSVTHYVIVHQTRKRVEIFRKVDDEWTVQVIGSSESLELDICDDTVTISMNEIYADIEFDEGLDLQVREDAEIYSW